MSCWTACTSGSTGGDGFAVTTGAAALMVAVGCVGGSDCVDGGVAVAEGGAAATSWSVGSGPGAAVGGATATDAAGEAVSAWVATSAAAACAAALEEDAGAGAVIRPARNPIPINKAVSAARMAPIESSETATGGTGVEGGTGAAALAGTGLAARGGAGSDGLVATATGSGSATSSASTGSSSATGSADAETVTPAVGAGGTWRLAGGRGGGFDARAAGGGTVDSGRGGSRGGRLVDRFVAGTFAGGWEGLVDVAKGAGFVGVSSRPSPKACATSILRLSVGSVSLFLSRPMAANTGTLRACREVDATAQSMLA